MALLAWSRQLEWLEPGRDAEPSSNEAVAVPLPSPMPDAWQPPRLSPLAAGDGKQDEAIGKVGEHQPTSKTVVSAKPRSVQWPLPRN